MSEPDYSVGAIGWLDLTSDRAPELRDFYAAVVGWKVAAVSMAGYDDYVMQSPATGAARAGVCHQRGPNVSQPSGWVPYFVVSDLEGSVRECCARGGRELADRRSSGFVVISDPSGAVCALYQQPK